MPAPVRVLLVNAFAAPLGGAEAHVDDLAALLREHGAAVQTYVPPPAAGIAAWRDRISNPVARREIAERIAAFRPDVVHVHNFLRRLGLAPFVAARAAGVPTLLTVHDFQLFCPRTWGIRSDGRPCDEPALLRCAFGACRGGVPGLGGRAVYAMNTARLRWIAPRVARLATRIVAPSAALAGRLTRVLGREVGVLPLRPTPAPDAAFTPPPSRDLVFVGRLSEEKGLREFLSAMGPETRLTVAGDGPAAAELRELAASRGLGASVRFVGRVPREDVPALVRAHGALVLPSVWLENSPVSILEASAAGRPTLASRRGGVPELVDDGRTGLLFEPTDPASVRAALDRWRAATDDDVAEMGRSAWRRAAAVGRAAAFAEMESAYRSTAR